MNSTRVPSGSVRSSWILPSTPSSLGIAAFGRFRAALFQFLLEFGRAHDAGREVIGAAELCERRMRGQIEHVLDPVRAVGHLHHHPVDAIGRIATLPVEMESEQVLVEVVECEAVAHHVTRVHDVRAEAAAGGCGRAGG